MTRRGDLHPRWSAPAQCKSPAGAQAEGSVAGGDRRATQGTASQGQVGASFGSEALLTHRTGERGGSEKQRAVCPRGVIRERDTFRRGCHFTQGFRGASSTLKILWLRAT